MTVSVRFDRVRPADASWLTEAERERLDRLVRPDDRLAYVAAHVLVRECAADVLGCVPADVELAQHCAVCRGSGHGRPFLPGAPEVAVSLSHSRSHVAAVATRSVGGCGIDVETVSHRSPPSRSLTARESAWVTTRPSPAAAFTQLWVRKEALVKAGVAHLEDAGRLEVLGDDGPADEVHGVALTPWSCGTAYGAVALG